LFKLNKALCPSDRRDFIFNDLKPGRYRVAAMLVEHHPVETEVTIDANNSKSVTMNFRHILYSVSINTNATGLISGTETRGSVLRKIADNQAFIDR
jgi:hypothetical protein